MTRPTRHPRVLAAACALVLLAAAAPLSAQASATAPEAPRGSALQMPVAQDPAPPADPRQRLRDARRQLAAAQQQVREADRQTREDTVRRRREVLRQRQAEARQRRVARRQGPGLSETITRTARLGRNGTLDLRNASGDVTITGGGSDVTIEAVKRVWHASDATARSLLGALDVEVTERGGAVDVRTRYPGDRDFNGVVDYTVTVPAGTSVVVTAVSGTVRVNNVGGDVRAETVSGHVQVSGSSRPRALRSVSGNVDIDGGQGDTLTASTVSGSVTARGARVRELELRAVSGDIRLTGVESERVRAQTLSGDIEYAGRLAPNGRYELRSHSGRIDVTPGDEAGFDLDAVTVGGALRSDYALALTNARGARRISGTFGRGGAWLSLRSFSGDIAVARR